MDFCKNLMTRPISGDYRSLQPREKTMVNGNTDPHETPLEITEIDNIGDYVANLGYGFDPDVPEGFRFSDHITGNTLTTPFKILVVDGYFVSESTKDMLLAYQDEEGSAQYQERDFAWLHYSLKKMQDEDRAEVFYSEMDLFNFQSPQYMTQLQFSRLSMEQLWRKCLRADLIGKIMDDFPDFQIAYANFLKLYEAKRPRNLTEVRQYLTWINNFVIRGEGLTDDERKQVPMCPLRVVAIKLINENYDKARLVVVPQYDVQIFAKLLKQQAKQQGRLEGEIVLPHFSLISQVLSIAYLKERGIVKDPLDKMTPKAKQMMDEMLAKRKELRKP